MTDTDTIPVSASVASTGKGIRYIGDHCYAYSGYLAIPNSNTNLLEFTTGSGYIKAEVLFSSRDSTADDYRAFISLNDQEVFGVFYRNTSLNYPYGTESIRLIIPPNTNVKVYMINISTASGYNWFATLTGRVYGDK